MKYLTTLIFLLALLTTNAVSQTILNYQFSGSDTTSVLIDVECELNLYEFDIKITTNYIPDRYVFLSSDSAVLFDSYYVPCNELSPVGENCRDGFFQYTSSGITYSNTLPYPWPHLSTNIEGEFRVLLTTYGSLEIVYYGNPNVVSTTSNVFVSYRQLSKNTVYLTSEVVNCQLPDYKIVGTCTDTIVTYSTVYVESITDTTLCYKDTLMLEGLYEYDGKYVENYVIATHDALLENKLYEGDCAPLNHVNLNVILPSITSDTIYLRKNQEIPNGIKDGIYYEEVGKCKFNWKVTVIRFPDSILYIPNSFSPNGDGINDVWTIPDSPYVRKIIDVKIFSRWGGLVHVGNNWTAEGCDVGVYVGKVVYLSVLDRVEEEYFTVSVLR